jgi:hypothetical protein
MLVYQYQLTLFDGTTTTLKTFVGDSYYFPTKVPMTVWVRSFNSGGITSADSAHITLSPLYGTSGASFESWGGTFTLPASATTNLATLIGSYGSFTHIDEIELFTDAPSFLSSSGVTATLGGLTLISSGDYDVKLDKNQSFDVSLENGGSLSSPAPLVFAGTITNSDTSAHTIGLLLKGTT